MESNIRPIYEFVLWSNCNRNCSFCWQKRQHDDLSANLMVDSILNVDLFIESSKFLNRSHVLLVGGELFDKPVQKYKEVIDKLLNLYAKLVLMLHDRKVDLLYINTNLLYEDTSQLEYVLDEAKKKNTLDRVRFTSSYDIEGRFRTDKDKLIFIRNLMHIKEKYLNLNVVINVVLTKQTCKYILDNSIDAIKYVLDNICYINFIPYISIDKSLMPTRNQVFNALIKIGKSADQYLKKYVLNFDLKQQKLVFKYNRDKKYLEFASAENNTCGHGANFTKYSETGSCFICDLKEVIGNV